MKIILSRVEAKSVLIYILCTIYLKFWWKHEIPHQNDGVSDILQFFWKKV
jgi:hypothetical protein